MITLPSARRTASVLGALLFTSVALHADDAKPKPVNLTEKSLTTEQAQAAQKAWADHLGFEVARKNSVGMQLRFIPPGTYRKGTPEGEKMRKKNEKELEVTLSQAFFIGQFELTQATWERVMGPFKRHQEFVGDRLPRYNVNYADATEFCRKLTKMEREAGTLPEGYVYRLPTDAEWEYACRAGTLTYTHFGDTLSSIQANFDGNRPFNDAEKGPNLDQPAEAGSYPANAWGLHEMHGNLCEWTIEWYHDEAKGGVDPVNLEPSRARLIKDCYWGYTGFHCKSANRYWAPANARSSTIGFRPVLTKVQFEE